MCRTMMAQPITVNLLQCFLNPLDVFKFAEIRQMQAVACQMQNRQEWNTDECNIENGVPTGTVACWLLCVQCSHTTTKFIAAYNYHIP